MTEHPGEDKVHDFFDNRIDKDAVLTDVNGVVLDKSELNIRLNNMETVTYYLDGVKTTYCPADQKNKDILPPLVNLCDFNIDHSLESKLNNLKGACFINDGDIRIYNNRIEIPYKPSNHKLLMSLLVGIILCGYRDINICCGLITVYFTDNINLKICF